MPASIESVLDEWSMPPLLTIVLLLVGCIYVRGWFAIRKTRQTQFTLMRLSCLLLGMAVLWVAVASPLDGFADVSLSPHMVQHLLLMSTVPPLLLLGWPVVPLLRGLPGWVLRPMLGPVLRSSVLRRLGRWLVSPVVAWLAMNATFVGWHVPAAYDFALRHEHWHEIEHICFLATALAFWWCIIRPWPAPNRRKSWKWLFYLLSADLVNTALSAFLAFCDRPVYSYYLSKPNPFHVSPLADQILGAVIMWVVGSFIFLAPATLMTFSLMQSTSARTR
jgi:cytochrome c oxidase assembly factor CtaG